MQNIEILDNFTINNIPNLDVAVMGALELFEKVHLPKIDLTNYRHPLVVGSGNAEATGRIIFSKSDAIFASESNFEEKLKNIPSIDSVVIISASGEKHAPIIAKRVKAMGKRVMLLTNTPGSSASKVFGDYADSFDEYVFPKNREPYTYNTSTYLSMVLGMTGENPSAVKDFIINVINKLDMPDFSKFDKYYLIFPPEFSEVIRMVNVKFIELFGRNIARDIETSEYVRHATTIAKSNELFISFGEKNNTWGEPENRLHIPLPDKCSYGAMIAISYYLVAQIQKVYPNFFKDNIEQYSVEISKIFGQELSPIVNNN